MTPPRPLAVLLLLAAVTAGCSAGSSTSTAADGAPGDAAPSPDAGSTATTTDGGTPDAARLDGGPSGDASAPLEAGPFDAAPGDAAPTVDAGLDAGLDGGPPRTTIRVHYPTAGHTLAIRGASAPLNWTAGAATSITSDGWTWSSDNLTTASDFKPLLDDATWSVGANYRVSPGETVDIYPRFRSTQGSYSVRWPNFASATLGRSRKVWVYLPPGYDENTVARYPVVYMHDGQNLFDRNASFGCWLADQALDRGASDGSIREAIVVGPEATNARITDYTPSYDSSEQAGGGAAAYLTSLVTELKPLVDRELRTLPGRETTAMIGSSLGGLVTAWTGVHHATTFGLVGAMSPSTWWDNTMILGEVASIPSRPSRPLRVYVDSGNAGPSLDDSVNTAQLAARFRTAGYTDGRDLLYVLASGHQHNEAYWAQRLPGTLRFLLGARPFNGSMP